MPQESTILLHWFPRERPLLPCAVAAHGEAARRLAHRLLAYSDSELEQLQAVGERETLVIRGDTEILPWVEGVIYLGQAADAPALLLPTALRPDFPAALLERAVRARFPTVAPPIAVLPGTRQLVSMAGARAVARVRLQAWLEGRH